MAPSGGGAGLFAATQVRLDAIVAGLGPLDDRVAEAAAEQQERIFAFPGDRAEERLDQHIRPARSAGKGSSGPSRWVP